MRLLLTVVLTLLLSGCATTHNVAYTGTPLTSLSGIQHTVGGGETLWSISKKYNVGLDELLRANSLRRSSVIASGQVLTIPRGGMAKGHTLYRTSSDNFVWPVRGDIISAYGSKTGNVINKGVDIRTRNGADIRSSRAGKVVYCDSNMKGFGKTVILEHGDKYQTVYSYNSDILVRVGDEVPQMYVIAKAGRTGRAIEPSLHFEIRKDGEPQNPSFYLPH